MSSALQVVTDDAGQGSAIADIAAPEIPGYRIERLIAEGGMASVFLARQESLDRPVALKLLKRFDDPTVAERFPNEGRVIASLNHRNIITIHDLGVVGDRHYISMEYLEGGTLQDRIAANGLTAHQALDLVEQIGECLDFAHRKGVVHRDIKPANILFRSDGTPVLSDFGIAKRREANAELTIAGTALGSPYYLSPEQAEGVPLDGRTDLYSLGVVLFELLTGERPYEHESAIQVILGHVTQPVPKLPASLACYQAFLDRLMAKDRHQRFPTAGAMVSKLRTLRGSQPILERRSRPALIEATALRPAKRRRLGLLLACGMIPTLAALIYASLPDPLHPSVLAVPTTAVDLSPVTKQPAPTGTVDSQPDQAERAAQTGFELWEMPPFAEDSGAGKAASAQGGPALAPDNHSPGVTSKRGSGGTDPAGARPTHGAIVDGPGRPGPASLSIDHSTQRQCLRVLPPGADPGARPCGSEAGDRRHRRRVRQPSGEGLSREPQRTGPTLSGPWLGREQPTPSSERAIETPALAGSPPASTKDDKKSKTCSRGTAWFQI